MTKPPKAAPHSDVDGVHQDERPNTEVAAERGESAGDLERAKGESAARPSYSNERPGKDDRTR